jgi:small subunit ribosomal protein S24e
MADNCVIRTRKFMKNPLLCRKQFVVEVLHEGRANVPKAELQSKICKMYKVKDDKTIFLWGFRTAFGGGRSTGFGVIYNDRSSALKFEPKARLRRAELAPPKTDTGRKLRKDKKNRAKKLRGKARAKILYGK